MERHNIGPLVAWVHPSKEGRAKARLLLIHGLSEHSGRHLNTISSLTSCGLDVVRFDLRGAGESGGRRQWVEKFEDYVDDTSRVFNWIQSEQPPLPLFLLGHSLGGAIALRFAAIYSRLLSGLILSAPAYLVGSSVPEWKLRLGKMLCPVVPWLRLPGSRDKSDLSRDSAVGRAFLSDPLTCQFNTLRQGDQILKALVGLPSECARISCPTLIVHGSADLIVRAEGSRELLGALASTDKHLEIFEGSYHEVHNDLEKDRYFRLLDEWVTRRIT